MKIRSKLYELNIKKSTNFQVPVIVVGNITTGGTGKTPVVIALVKILKEQGYSPGIVSRGYKAEASSWPAHVTAFSTAAQVGDEPLLIFNSTSCPVVVDPDRVRAVTSLLTTYACDMVLSDDGLQHLQLGRSLEIAVVDGERGFGNGYCLPTGPLREPVSRLACVDFVLTRSNNLTARYPVQLEAGAIVALKDSTHILDLKSLAGRKIHAVSGIANPDQFFNSLRARGLVFTSHAFRDHYPFTRSDFAFLQAEDCVIMTEKDAVKCKPFADNRFYYLTLQAVLPQQFITDFLMRLHKN